MFYGIGPTARFGISKIVDTFKDHPINVKRIYLAGRSNRSAEDTNRLEGFKRNLERGSTIEFVVLPERDIPKYLAETDIFFLTASMAPDGIKDRFEMSVFNAPIADHAAEFFSDVDYRGAVHIVTNQPEAIAYRFAQRRQMMDSRFDPRVVSGSGDLDREHANAELLRIVQNLVPEEIGYSTIFCIGYHGAGALPIFHQLTLILKSGDEIPMEIGRENQGYLIDAVRLFGYEAKILSNKAGDKGTPTLWSVGSAFSNFVELYAKGGMMNLGIFDLSINAYALLPAGLSGNLAVPFRAFMEKIPPDEKEKADHEAYSLLDPDKVRNAMAKLKSQGILLKSAETLDVNLSLPPGAQEIMIDEPTTVTAPLPALQPAADQKKATPLKRQTIHLYSQHVDKPQAMLLHELVSGRYVAEIPFSPGKSGIIQIRRHGPRIYVLDHVLRPGKKAGYHLFCGSEENFHPVLSIPEGDYNGFDVFGDLLFLANGNTRQEPIHVFNMGTNNKERSYTGITGSCNGVHAIPGADSRLAGIMGMFNNKIYFWREGRSRDPEDLGISSSVFDHLTCAKFQGNILVGFGSQDTAYIRRVGSTTEAISREFPAKDGKVAFDSDGKTFFHAYVINPNSSLERWCSLTLEGLLQSQPLFREEPSWPGTKEKNAGRALQEHLKGHPITGIHVTPHAVVVSNAAGFYFLFDKKPFRYRVHHQLESAGRECYAIQETT